MGTLILSPHLDDAALSCSAYMQAVHDVTIATIFARSEPDAQYRHRRDEDTRACRMLGARPIHLDFLDAPYRSAEYRGFEGIIFGRAAEYDTTVQEIAKVIRRLIRRHSPDRLLAPLAAGNHVDHRIVRDAALIAADPARLLFYEDRPYALVREHVEHALGTPISSQPAAFWQRYGETTYIRSYMRNLTIDVIRDSWRSVPFFPRALRVALTLRESAGAALVIREYASQWTLLYKDTQELRASLRVPETYYALT